MKKVFVSEEPELHEAAEVFRSHYSRTAPSSTLMIWQISHIRSTGMIWDTFALAAMENGQLDPL